MPMADDNKDPEVRMSHLAGRDARRIMLNNPIILVPMGSHEDQGPHAPMGDFLIAQRIAELGAERAHELGVPTYVAPVIPFGSEDFFRSAIGGAIVQPATMIAFLRDVLSSFIDNGLTRIVVVNGHLGNISPITTAVRTLRVERGLTIPAINIWEAAYLALADILGPVETKKRASHGADPLASVALHLFPELVKQEYFPEPKMIERDSLFGLEFISIGKANLDGVPVALPSDYADVFHEGVGNGDPRLCDTSTGSEICSRLVTAIASLARLMSEKMLSSKAT